MEKKNTAIANIPNGYVISPDGKIAPLSYQDAVENADKLHIKPETVEILRNIHDGIKEQTNGTFKIGYNIAQLTKGENPEYLRMGYPSIRALITDMFDINEVTGYKWADTASRFVTYDATTGEYHSIFATEFNGKTYDFTMSQLSEMRFPLDKKGSEIIDLSIWKTMFENHVITTSTTTKGIRKIQNILVALAKQNRELTVQNVHDLYEKSEKLAMTPEKALTYKEQTAQGTAQTAQTAQGTAQTAQTAQGTAQTAQTAQGTAQTAQTAQGTAQTAQTAQGTAQTAQDIDDMVQNAIHDAITSGTINDMISSAIHESMKCFEKYMVENNSEIVRCAIVGMINAYLQTVPTTLTEQTAQTAQGTAQTAQTAQGTAQAKSVKSDKTVSTRKTKSSK